MTIEERLDLVRDFRKVADALEQDRDGKFALLDVKFFLVCALNEVDRAMNYGKPGLGLDLVLAGSDRPVNP